ncbi:30S ribosomal protein S9P domain protein [Necator americanus]|uniref:30S ribosomal protein S9P domain protein n=1 Tax=Necator americanus TaxID=51031 RepID=W2TB77_NECAM|nr:30S ribosomal protein S9P domain protein [Necator americanus]ETN78839.1 30S ribosomal protein S9P domain protein [Necator americanus]
MPQAHGHGHVTGREYCAFARGYCTSGTGQGKVLRKDHDLVEKKKMQRRPVCDLSTATDIKIKYVKKRSQFLAVFAKEIKGNYGITLFKAEE